MTTNKVNYTESGYIALSTVLITLALVLLIGLSSSLLSINDLQSSQSGKISNVTVDMVESCVEDVLLRLNDIGSVTAGSMSLPLGDCSVTINSQADDIWDFTVSTTLDAYTKSVRVNVTKGETVTVDSWMDE